MHRVGDLVRAVASLALTLTLVAGCSADVSLSGAPDAAGTPTEPPAEADPTPTTTPESEPEEPTAVEAPTPGSGPLIDHPLATGLLGTDDLGTIWTVVRTDLVLTGSAPAATPNPGGCVLLGQVNRATEWFAIQTELDGPEGRHLLHQLGRAPDERSAAEVVASVTALPSACPPNASPARRSTS